MSNTAEVLQPTPAATLDPRTLIPGDPLPGGEFVGLIYPDRIPTALIIGPEYDGELNWKDATAWAAELVVDGVTGFYLPSRSEGHLAQANLPKRFKPASYWLGEQRASGSGNAWYQSFSFGYQSGWGKDGHLRARAFRRLVIQ